jgi:hypothetical protein
MCSDYCAEKTLVSIGGPDNGLIGRVCIDGLSRFFEMDYGLTRLLGAKEGIWVV